MGLISQKTIKNKAQQNNEVHFMIYNHFVKPVPQIERLINKYKKLWDGYFLIGVHIRTNGGKGNFLKQRGIKKMIQLLEKVTKEFNKSNIKWFIAADSKDILNSLKLQYPQYILTTDEMPITHSRLNINGVDLGVYHSIVDSYLLSHCDYLILTGGSTFSSMALHRSFLSIKVLLGNNFLVCDKCKSVIVSN